uniref:Uncharacterized protein n=1 Tax=Schizaphis graminum TaxID=13262 RepID=A0A2S2NVP6_SCHGA
MCADPSRVIGPPAVQCRRAPTAAAGGTPRDGPSAAADVSCCPVRARRARERERAVFIPHTEHVHGQHYIMCGVCECARGIIEYTDLRLLLSTAATAVAVIILYALLFTSLPIRTVPHTRRYNMRARSLPCSGHRGIETLMYM